MPADKTIRSFVLRQGRITRGQQQALEQWWPVYGIEYGHEKLDLDAEFNRTAPVILEIGFGNGDSLLQQAVNHPKKNYLGIEVHRPGVGHLLRRVAEAGISNVRVVNHDAIEVLKHQIPDNSLDCVQLFFPDPWHKKRHHKRRIVKSEFIQEIHRCLKNGGVFHLATDWEDYAEHMMAEMEQARGFVNAAGKGQYAVAAERPSTKFEARGRRLGHGVWDLLFRKN